MEFWDSEVISPSWIGIRSPSASNAIKLFVDGKIFKSKVMLQSVSHGDASRSGADDDGTEATVVG
jgi:hypothetical protein